MVSKLVRVVGMVTQGNRNTDARTLVLRGKTTLERGDNKAALELFEKARALDPENSELVPYLLYCEYQLIPKGKDGAPTDLAQAQAIFKEFQREYAREQNEENAALMVFYGVASLGLGNQKKAKRLFKEAVRLEPRNTLAQRQLRLLEMREGKSSSRGFFSQFLEKFSK